MSLEKLKEFKKEIDSLKENVANKEKEAFKEGCKDVFEKYPEVKSFGWEQWTPSFNDGDPCYFHTNIDVYSLSINGINEDNEDGEYEEGETKIDNKKEKEIRNYICDFLNFFDENYFERTYGDGVSVNITSNGISIKDYDCGY